jgi:hypothetical protein
MRLNDLENYFSEAETTIVMGEFDKAQEDEEYLKRYDEETRAVFGDKDSLNTVLMASHDNHLTTLSQSEEEHQTIEVKRVQHLSQSIRENEYRRNRSRVQEIWSFVQDNEQELDQIASETE